MRDCKHGQLARSCNLCELDAEIYALRHQLFLSANVINATRVLVEAGYDRRLNEYKAAFGKVERALLVYDDLTKNVGEPVHSAQLGDTDG